MTVEFASAYLIPYYFDQKEKCHKVLIGRKAVIGYPNLLKYLNSDSDNEVNYTVHTQENHNRKDYKDSFKRNFLFPQGGLHTLLGGKRKKGEEVPQTTAVREFCEELDGLSTSFDENIKNAILKHLDGKNPIEYTDKNSNTKKTRCYYILNLDDESLSPNLKVTLKQKLIAEINNENEAIQSFEKTFTQCVEKNDKPGLIKLLDKAKVDEGKAEMSKLKWVEIDKLANVMNENSEDYIQKQVKSLFQVIEQSHGCQAVLGSIRQHCNDVPATNGDVEREIIQFLTQDFVESRIKKLPQELQKRISKTTSNERAKEGSEPVGIIAGNSLLNDGWVPVQKNKKGFTNKNPAGHGTSQETPVLNRYETLPVKSGGSDENEEVSRSPSPQ